MKVSVKDCVSRRKSTAAESAECGGTTKVRQPGSQEMALKHWFFSTQSTWGPTVSTIDTKCNIILSTSWKGIFAGLMYYVGSFVWRLLRCWGSECVMVVEKFVRWRIDPSCCDTIVCWLLVLRCTVVVLLYMKRGVVVLKRLFWGAVMPGSKFWPTPIGAAKCFGT